MRFYKTCLKYTEVDVEGLTDTVVALNDSGCQLCAVNAETVRSLDLPVFGQVKLRGISDRHLVPADVDQDPSETNYRQGICQYYLCGS